jgi:hypothetical protein
MSSTIVGCSIMLSVRPDTGPTGRQEKRGRPPTIVTPEKTQRPNQWPLPISYDRRPIMPSLLSTPATGPTSVGRRKRTRRTTARAQPFRHMSQRPNCHFDHSPTFHLSTTNIFVTSSGRRERKERTGPFMYHDRVLRSPSLAAVSSSRSAVASIERPLSFHGSSYWPSNDTRKDDDDDTVSVRARQR